MLYITENIVFKYLKLTHIIITLYIIINSSLVYSIAYNYKSLYKFIQSYKNTTDPNVEQIRTEIKEKTNELTKLDESTLSLENWVYEV